MKRRLFVKNNTMPAAQFTHVLDDKSVQSVQRLFGLMFVDAFFDRLDGLTGLAGKGLLAPISADPV